MTWHTITGAGTSTATKFFGDVMNKINDMFNGVDISDIVIINTAVTWKFQGSSLNVMDSDNSNSYTILGGALAGDFAVSFPTIIANDTFPLLGIDQIFTGVNQLDKEFIHKVVAVPGNPATGFIKHFPKQVDANNDGTFTIQNIGGSMTQVRIS